MKINIQASIKSSKASFLEEIQHVEAHMEEDEIEEVDIEIPNVTRPTSTKIVEPSFSERSPLQSSDETMIVNE